MSAGVHARAGEDASFTDVKIKPQIGNVNQEVWMTSCIGGFEKRQLVEFLPPKKKVDFRSSPRPCSWYRTWEVGGGRWKSQHRKIVYLSPSVEKPFNSKVIKSFIPELRSRKCFSCFGIPMLSIYELWTFYVYFTYPYHGYVTEARNNLDSTKMSLILLAFPILGLLMRLPSGYWQGERLLGTRRSA